MDLGCINGGSGSSNGSSWLSKNGFLVQLFWMEVSAHLRFKVQQWWLRVYKYCFWSGNCGSGCRIGGCVVCVFLGQPMVAEVALVLLGAAIIFADAGKEEECATRWS